VPAQDNVSSKTGKKRTPCMAMIDALAVSSCYSNTWHKRQLHPDDVGKLSLFRRSILQYQYTGYMYYADMLYLYA
jgi:hypothetical protein